MAVVAVPFILYLVRFCSCTSTVSMKSTVRYCTVVSTVPSGLSLPRGTSIRSKSGEIEDILYS